MIGALLVACTVWALLLPPSWTSLKEVSVIATAAFFGCLIDSVLGVTVQAHYWDEESDTITEHPEKDGRSLPLERGVRWFDNDMVNLVSNGVASLLAYSLMAILS